LSPLNSLTQVNIYHLIQSLKIIITVLYCLFDDVGV
jgi:hypothetical protein